MVARSGKEPAHSPAPSDEAAEHDMSSLATVQQGRRRAGVNRQAQQSAQEHQRAAGQASGVKRKAEAMPEDERKRRKAAHAKEVRAAAKQEREQQAAAARADAAEAAAVPTVEVAALGSTERLDFEDWLHQRSWLDLPLDDGSLEEWRMSDHYEHAKRARIVEGCTCFLEPGGGRRVTSLPYEELKRRVDDGVTRKEGESFDAWDDRVSDDREARGVPLGDYFNTPLAYMWAGDYRQCTCTYDGHGDEARVLPDVPGESCDTYDAGEARQQLEHQAGDWQPSGGDWSPEGWDAAQPDDSEPDAPPPPSPLPALPLPQASPPPPADDDSDAYELDQERMLEEQGRVSAIHGRPWHEVARGATEPLHWLDCVRRADSLALLLSQRQQPQRPLSPAPEVDSFETENEYLRERARWFRDHGDGGELPGATRREHGTRSFSA